MREIAIRLIYKLLELRFRLWNTGVMEYWSNEYFGFWADFIKRNIILDFDRPNPDRLSSFSGPALLPGKARRSVWKYYELRRCKQRGINRNNYNRPKERKVKPGPADKMGQLIENGAC